MIAGIADIIILALVLGYCGYIIYRKQMGDTNSMLYAIGAFILIYLIAMGIYQLVLWIRKKRKNR